MYFHSHWQEIGRLPLDVNSVPRTRNPLFLHHPMSPLFFSDWAVAPSPMFTFHHHESPIKKRPRPGEKKAGPVTETRPTEMPAEHGNRKGLFLEGLSV